MRNLARLLLVVFLAALDSTAVAAEASRDLKTVITYWAGPRLDRQSLARIKAANFNTVFCRSSELGLVREFGLNAILTDEFLQQESKKGFQEKAEKLVQELGDDTASVGFYLGDEPSSLRFSDLGTRTQILKTLSPGRFSFVNLLPTYASNRQLGETGGTEAAYRRYLDNFFDIVRPQILSYDHYHFGKDSDGGGYFFNLSLIREYSNRTKVPFLNTVQATTWSKDMRFPTPEELRFLVNTTLAYGGAHVAYYAYTYPGPRGGFEKTDGSPTPLYPEVTQLNSRFASVRVLLGERASTGVFHAGPIPSGALELPNDSMIDLQPRPFGGLRLPGSPAEGFAVGFFGTETRTDMAYIVNLDYRQPRSVGVLSKTSIELYDFAAKRWTRLTAGQQVEFQPAEGKLLRLGQ